MKFVILTFMATLVSLMVITQAKAGFEENLVLYLSFDEREDEMVKDLSPAGNDAAIWGEVAFSEGKYGLALEFDEEGREQKSIDAEDGDRLFIEDSPSLDFNDQPFTIAAWINLKSTNVGHSTDSYTLIINKRVGFADNFCNYAIFINRTGGGDFQPGLVQFAIGDLEVCERIEFEKTLSAGKWYHLAISFDPDADKVNYYLDGSLQEAADTHIQPTADEETPVYVGAQPIKTERISRFYDGKIDDLVVYNRVLTEKMIKSDMSGSVLSISPSGNAATTWGWLKSG